MSTLIVAVILMACVTLICIVFNLLHNQNQNRQKEKLLNTFREAASVHGLALNRQETLRNRIFGIDVWKKSILVYDTRPDEHITYLSLTGMKHCSLSKTFIGFNTGSEKQPKIEKQLRSIELRLEFYDSAQPFALVFYDSNTNSLYEMPELEEKAKNWEAVLSTLITVAQKSRA